jgi:hypothetical protein
MSEGKRPGGLTALAVLNFVAAAGDLLNAFGLLMTWLLLNVPEFAARVPMDEKGKHGLEMMRELGNVVLGCLIAVHVVLGALLILSGVGYLLQKRFLGRKLGNAYALLSVATTVAMVFGMRRGTDGGDFQLITLVLILYPVLTLALINTTFREDFVN